MKKKLSCVATLALSATMLMGVPAHATNVGNEGCTPGYWKNHTSNWFEGENKTAPIAKDTKLNSARVGYKTSPEFVNATLLDALKFQGGTGRLGAERNLLRAAAAAWLNAAHEGLGYPLRRYGTEDGVVGFVQRVNEAIASGNAMAMETLKNELDRANNLGCPLN